MIFGNRAITDVAVHRDLVAVDGEPDGFTHGEHVHGPAFAADTPARIHAAVYDHVAIDYDVTQKKTS